MKKCVVFLTACALIILLTGCGAFISRGTTAEDSPAPAPATETDQTQAAAPKPVMTLQESLSRYVKDNTSSSYDVMFPPGTSVEKVDDRDEGTTIVFSPAITAFPFREESLAALRSNITKIVLEYRGEGSVTLVAGHRTLEEFIPPVYRTGKPIETTAPAPAIAPWVRRVSSPAPQATAGLYGRHICLWGSHGWFYDTNEKRWEWQRPRMFTVVEDLLPTAFMLPFLVPMLENAGAVTAYPRERDWQFHEVLVDDGDGGDRSENGLFIPKTPDAWKPGEGRGFKNGMAPYEDGVNPHAAGGHHVGPARGAAAQWVPNIPETGHYAVYVSYNMAPDRDEGASYVIRHSGGISQFLVNQRIGGNTWVYLGNFLFQKGMKAELGSVELTGTSSDASATISADCVKFGGGMGDSMRGGSTSGYPRYCEAGRYWLSFAGVDQDLVFRYGFKGDGDGVDYTEDYVSRAEYANYLKGAPCGPNPNRDHPGLGVPVDLAFGMHTDAGIKNGIVGTLSIYNETGDKKDPTFPDGSPRFDDNRMLSDLIQTEIVEDVRALFTSSWTRRRLWNQSYSENRRGNMPSSLLELLSHQNFHDQKYALDPRFRFHVSRAIYKAMLRFLAHKNGYEPVVQPLSPKHLVISRRSDTSAWLSWKSCPDPLEPTAVPDAYVVYRREGSSESAADFDSGILVRGEGFLCEGLDPGMVYSFRVTAVNAGGESFPSEALSIRTGNRPDGKRALIVSAFDRLAPPSFIMAPGHEGVDRSDHGVGYLVNFGLSGNQWDFDPKSEFRTNDAPGHGASDGDMETLLELGNTFDFVIRHGAALSSAEWGFDSASDEAVREGMPQLGEYAFVDWLLGEERTTNPPAGIEKEGAPDRMQPDFEALTQRDRELIKGYLESGGALFLNGAYVATDLAGRPDATEEGRAFLTDILRGYWTADCGSKTNVVFTASESPFQTPARFQISMGPGMDGIYGVELPDALKPASPPKNDKNYEPSETLLRYGDNGWSAAIGFRKSHRFIVFGFPFECVAGEETRHAVMAEVLAYLFAPAP